MAWPILPVFVEIVVVDIILYDKCIDHADADADSSESTCLPRTYRRGRQLDILQITRDHSFESKLGYASPARAQTAIHVGDMAFCHWYRKKMSKTITILFLTTGLYGMSYPKRIS